MTLSYIYTFPTVSTMLQNIASSIIRLNGLVLPLHTKFDQFSEKVENDLQMLRVSMDSLNHSISNLSTCLQEHKQQTQSEMNSLQTNTQATLINHLEINYKLDALNSILNIHDKMLTTSLQEHKQQTATEVSHLQTSLTSTRSKLDTFTNTTSSDLQRIIDNMTDMECMDTQENIRLHENLQHNLIHQLKTIRVRTCGGTRGWRRVIYLNMTDPHTTCPSGWQLTGYTKRTCGRVSNGYHTCDSATFLVSGGQYTRICGRIKAYQYGGPDAFSGYHNRKATTIDGAYVSGVSVTHGTPRYHIWTFANGAAELETSIFPHG